jgi:hypothetical protein
MNYLLTIILFSTFLIFTACGPKDTIQTENSKNKNINVPTSTATPEKEITATECKICDFDFEKYQGDLKKEEIEGLLLALNDEYMAWATYDRINKDFDDPRPFINIQKAEARHIERLKELFENYKMPVPENKWTGKVQKFSSVKEACSLGVEAEIINGKLYEKLLKTTTREDILLVYRNLKRASEENHLPAFRRCGEGGKGFGRGRGRGNN